VSARATAALQVIASALRAQEEELAKLRGRTAAFDKIRQMLDS
jgi:hypothetical protein